jgi:hypothetical protein
VKNHGNCLSCSLLQLDARFCRTYQTAGGGHLFSLHWWYFNVLVICDANQRFLRKREERVDVYFECSSTI